MEGSMSEENTTAVEETVSETPATETTQDSSNEQYIAESKKYRKRAQDAESRLAELEKSLAKVEEGKLYIQETAGSEQVKYTKHTTTETNYLYTN